MSCAGSNAGQVTPLNDQKVSSVDHGKNLQTDTVSNKITVISVTPANLSAYRRIITTTLPIRYPDKFYKLSVSRPEETGTISLCAFYTSLSSSVGIAKKKRHAQGEDISFKNDTADLTSSADKTITQLDSSDHGPELNTNLTSYVLDDTGISKNESLVAGLQARFEPPLPSVQLNDKDLTQDVPSEDAKCIEYTLYIQTLAVLAPYRRLGLASHLLAKALHKALSLPLFQMPTLTGVLNTDTHHSTDDHSWAKLTHITAHVWEANAEALEFYQRNGFEVDPEILPGYYRRLRPDGARMVRKAIRIADYLQCTKKN